MASMILLLVRSRRIILLCLPMISIIKLTEMASPISFLLETRISRIRSFSNCSIPSMTAPWRYLRMTIIKVLGKAGFSKLVWVRWIRPKTEWAESKSFWFFRLPRIWSTNSCSKGWLIFWMRPLKSSAFNSCTIWCKKNPSKDMGFLIILAVILVNYIKNRAEIPERSKGM